MENNYPSQPRQSSHTEIELANYTVDTHEISIPSHTPHTLHSIASEIISHILSYFFYYASPYYGKCIFVPLDRNIKNARLVCKSWNSAFENDFYGKLKEYYFHNITFFQSRYMDRLPDHLYAKLEPTLLPLPTTLEAINSVNVSKQMNTVLLFNYRILKQFYATSMEKRRYRRNRGFFTQETVYTRWIIAATLIYFCWIYFFAMLCMYDIFVWIFGAVISETLLCYFYNIAFVPLYCIAGIICVHELLSISLSSFMTKLHKINAFLFSFGGFVLFCTIIESPIFLIQLNIAILPLLPFPTVFGRKETIPWLVVFIPWYCLTVIFILCCIVFFIVRLFRKSDSDTNRIYYCSIFGFLIIESMLTLVVLILIGIGLEFPSIINVTYSFIPAYSMEIALIIYMLINGILEKTNAVPKKWTEHGLWRMICMIWFAMGMILNHILCTLSWYHFVPLFVAYLQLIIPITCFYIWTMLMLYPHHKRKMKNLQSCNIVQARSSKQCAIELWDGTWRRNLTGLEDNEM